MEHLQKLETTLLAQSLTYLGKIEATLLDRVTKTNSNSKNQ